MKMSGLEKLMVNSPARILFQQLVPTPFFLRHSHLCPQPCCLEVGCGQGAGTEIILREFRACRVLKPRGEFFYEEVLQPLLENRLFAKLFPHPQQAYFTRSEFEQALVQVGFKLGASRQWGKSYLLGIARKP